MNTTRNYSVIHLDGSVTLIEQTAKQRTFTTLDSISHAVRYMVQHLMMIPMENVITEDSPNGLMEANNYTWERDRNGNWTNEPGRKFNHFWDAARYVVYTEGHSPGKGWRRGVQIIN